MNWTKGGKLSEEEIEHLTQNDVVYVEFHAGDDIIWRVADVGTLDRIGVDLIYWEAYNVSVEGISEDAEYRAGREEMRKHGWTDELFEQYFPNQYDLRILPDMPLDHTPEDEQANRDWGSFS